MSGQGTIVATGSIAYPPGLAAIGAMLGAEKVMTMTSTYDHRIIQGAESGQFLAEVEAYLQGDHDFYERIFADVDAPVGAVPPPPAPAAAAAAQRAAAVEQPTAAGGLPVAPDEVLLQAVQAATSVLKAHRMHGHLAARLDPLGSEPEGDPALDPETVGLTPELMARIPAKILRTHVPGATLADALPHLRETYCGTIAYEIEHIASHRQRTWLREKIESGACRSPLTHEEQRLLLRRLTQVDSLERFMHKAYLGQKQFSIEGLDMTIPMLDEMIQLSASQGAREVVIGMAHRGRLNVLAHCLGRAYETIFREFEGASSIEAVTTIPQGGTGDVKYHHGAQGTYPLPDDASIIVRLESNPSHLEYVAPVVGRRDAAVQTDAPGPARHVDPNAALPIILHGDAAFPGQGVVGRDVQPAGARRLHGRRHDPPDPEQPGRLHRPIRTTRAPPAGPRISPRASTCRSSTSTPTTSRRASPPCAWRSLPPGVRPRRPASTRSATGAGATTRPTSPPTRSPSRPARSRARRPSARSTRTSSWSAK
jgi:2-oxoglutarate dehydrogenase E1 component